MDFCQISILVVSVLHGAEFPFYKVAVKEQSAVLSVVIIILRVGVSAHISYTGCPSFIDHMSRMTIDHRLQSHFTELKDCRPHHPFKSQIIADIYGFLFCKIFSCINKSDAISFCIGTRHIINFFLRKTVQEKSHTGLISGYVFAIAVKIPQILKI